MWGATLSRPLPIIALVSRYLTNQLMGRTPILKRLSFTLIHMRGSEHMGY